MEIPMPMGRVPPLYLNLVDPPLKQTSSSSEYTTFSLGSHNHSALLISIASHGYYSEEARGRGRVHRACHHRRPVCCFWRCFVRVCAHTTCSPQDGITNKPADMILVPLVVSWE